MNGLTFMQLCHAISSTLFLHSFLMSADSSSVKHSSPLIPISFTANDYKNNNNWTQHHIITSDDQWLNSSICPQKCKCAYIASHYSIEELRTIECNGVLLPKSISTETESLHVINNSMDSLPIDSFISLHELQVLNLSYNGLNHIGRGHVFNNLSHLKVLDLSHNNLRHLFAGLFRGLRRLQVLIINDCGLRYLDEHTFDGLEMLSDLSLSYNQISSVYLELFQSISNLKTLNLDHNYILHLTGGIFTTMSTLQTLRLSHNRILTINDNAFVGLDMLQELYLDNNSLVRVPNIALQSLKRIINIHMDSNPLIQLSTGDFVHLSAQYITLTNCSHLQLIDRGAFWDLPYLYILELQNNTKLAFIDPHAFVSLPLLHTIKLDNCGLKSIQNDIISNILGSSEYSGDFNNVGISNSPNKHVKEHHLNKHIISASLMGNPFLCDCNIHYLYKCLIDQQNCSLKVTEPQRITCWEPQEMNNTQIIQLNISVIPVQCSPRLVSTTTTNVTIHKKIGDKQQFQCRALGLPVPKVHWILPNGDVVNDTSNIIHYQLNKQTGSLRMYHLKPRDSGVYQCVAENNLGSVMAKMRLIIDHIDLHLYPLTVSSNYVTLVWNGTGRNSFNEYQIIYKVIDNNSSNDSTNSTDPPLDNQLAGNWHSNYESVTVNHLLRSYSLTHLKPNTQYWICLTVRDADAHNGYVQLSCTTVVTKMAVNSTAKAVAEESGSFALALCLSAAIIAVFLSYFLFVGLKKYRIHRQYETPAPKQSMVGTVGGYPGLQNETNLPHIPLENIKT
ncbi:leucine-rich repeat neuronal protein 1-like [Oppia nitens]|uniref:leucine-rich repeat neuronal protein 1-like n=1 Tax=Oppia nitens TaxID=1686743 RepID=UPI0023DA7F05|nr:leucine-rich repeat neuronal protein 1-like [Oppia nitens]